MKKVDTVMTYEDWCKAHRKTLKKIFRDTLSYCFRCVLISLMFTALPIGMFAHWLLVGY